jgi:class 3 adenylate cyclase
VEHGGKEVARMLRALGGGIAVLVVAVVVATIVGLRISQRIKALSSAARAVQSGHLEAVPQLQGSGIREIDDAARSFGQMIDGLRERNMIRETLGRFVPEQIAHALLDEGGQLEPSETEATLLFCDIEGFTRLTETLGPRGIVEVLNAFFSEMVRILEKHGGVVTQFQGDAILATFNVPIPDRAHAANALHAALEMQSKTEAGGFGGRPLRIRIGVNTGPVVAGAVGAEGRLSYTVHGDAVNLAARLESMNKAFGTRILASEQVIARTHGFVARQVEETPVRGQSHPVRIYEVTGSLAQSQP